MGYESQVRKLHGKVKIIYQDADASYDIAITTSGNSNLSFPIQVYQGNISPTVKACTLEGNSTMNGEFQMMDSDCIIGWWSNTLSDTNGAYNSANYPYLLMDFIKRPVGKWTLIGDSKLNQYPVDFDVIIYDESNNILETQTITNNNQVQTTINFSQTYSDVKKIKLIIKKINVANAVIKILQFFDILEENYEGSDVKDFEVVEELSTDGDGVSYGINSNTMSVTIYNKDRRFDQGYLKDFLLLDRKVIPFIGIEDDNGNTQYSQIGVYYSDEWSVPQNDQWVKLKCLDRLMKFQKITYVGYPYSQNVSLKTITANILQSAGLTSEEYEIDDALDDIVVPYAFLGKKSVWDALQDVCNAGLCRVYTTRDNKIKVSIENLDVINDGITINPGKTFGYEVQTRKTDFSNHIEVDYSDINASQTSATREVVYSNAISLDANSRRTMIVDYSQNITNAILTFTPIGTIRLNSFQSSINCGKFELENLTNETIIANVEVTGLVIAVNTQTVIIEDAESVENYGVMSFKHSSSDLVQTYARAVEIGNYFMSILNQGAGTLRINWRGNPSLMLEDKFTCVDRFGASKEYINQYNRFTFNGGLKQETKAREVNNGNDS